MPRELSNVDAVLNLIFSGGPSQVDTEELDHLEAQIDELDSSQRPERQQALNQRPSIYVKVFSDMFDEVKGFEKYLFSDDEWSLMDQLSTLDYQARYLLVRLLCRNRGRWLRYKHLEKYVSEISEEGIRKSMITLSKRPKPPAQVIDLTGENDEEDNLSRGSPPELDHLCTSEATMPIELILDTLDLRDLKGLAKDFKVAPGTSKKADFKAALLKHARNQTILPLEASPKKPKKKTSDKFTQTKLAFQVKTPRKSSAASQEQHLKDLALTRLGKCVSVNENLFLLIRRMCIIYYRSTHMPRDILRPSLLSEFKKRVYPKYNYRRSTIYNTRQDLLDFEAALELEEKLQVILDADEDAVQAMRKIEAQTPLMSVHAQSQTSQADEGDMDIDIPAPLTTLEIRSGRVKEMLEETVLPLWRKCVQSKQKELPEAEPRPGLSRFEPGYVYTRMVEKGTEALGHLKEYSPQIKLLNELLAQRFWRRGKRGDWYDRRALTTITYLSKSDGKKRKDNKVLHEALHGLREALEDDDTHIICRPGLLRRLQKLEKTLKVPENERVDCVAKLEEPEATYIRATRVKSEDVKTNQPGQFKLKGKENKPNFSLAGNGGRKWGVKSVWYGDRNEEVNVETRALQDYDKLGYKGIHAETSILTTIFGLLFWDIIFADVPGAFETKFQVAPLDIAEDSFYLTRKEIIEKRLQEIRSGRALEILDRHDRTYRPTNTWCVGVRWDLCSKEDLSEIVECLTGSSLATVCQIFAEDYSGRCSGIPDLIVWKHEELECKFVEVKGPGDKPSENQKLWFDALHHANITVELCHVVDLNAKAKRINKKLKRKALEMEVVLSGSEDENAPPLQAESVNTGTPGGTKLEYDLDEGSPLALSQEWHRSPPRAIHSTVKAEVSVDTPIRAKRAKVED